MEYVYTNIVSKMLTGWASSRPWVFQQIQLAAPDKDARTDSKKSNIPLKDPDDGVVVHQVQAKSNIPLHDTAEGVGAVTTKSDIPSQDKGGTADQTASQARAKSNISPGDISEEDLKTIMPLLSPSSPNVEKTSVRPDIAVDKGKDSAMVQNAGKPILKSNLAQQPKADLPMLAQQPHSDLKGASFRQFSPAVINKLRPPAIPVRTNIPMKSHVTMPMTANGITQTPQMSHQYQLAPAQRSAVPQTLANYYAPSTFHMSRNQPQNTPRSAVPVPIMPWYQHPYPRGNIPARTQVYTPYHSVTSWPVAARQPVMYQARNRIPYYHANIPAYRPQYRTVRQPGSYYNRSNVFPGHPA